MVRLPAVPGITDDDDNVARWGAFIAGLHRMPRVQLLPYHRTGEAKYSLLGMDGERREIATPAMERLEEIAGALGTFGLDADIGAQWK